MRQYNRIHAKKNFRSIRLFSPHPVKVPAILLLLVLIAACSSTPTPKGILYTKTRGPVFATSNEVSTKTGKASVISIFGLVSTGDVSVENIATMNGIKKIHHVDYEDYSWCFGIYQEYTVFVYGE